MPLRHSSTLSDHRATWLAFLVVGLVACGDTTGERPAAIGAFDAVLRDRISVSGVSAGGYMAVQAHVAFADKIGGVAVIAGGPYHCAGGSVKTAVERCLTGEGLVVEPLIAFANEAASAGNIAPIADIASANVWIFHSPADSVVSPRAGVALHDFYAAIVPASQIVVVDDVETAHGWATLDAGADCMEWGGDYINACNYDTAGELLRHLYGDLEPRGAANPDNLIALDVSGYFHSGSDVAGIAYTYAPTTCRSGDTECRLHIALHGCTQGAEFIEDRFVTQAGFNEWAETNDIIVVYPQVEKSLFNPQGCWDWWGYTDDDYDLRSGKQVAGMSAVIDAFASGTLPLEQRLR